MTPCALEILKHTVSPFVYTHPKTNYRTVIIDKKTQIFVLSSIVMGASGFYLVYAAAIAIGTSVCYGLSAAFKAYKLRQERFDGGPPESHNPAQWLSNYKKAVNDKSRLNPRNAKEQLLVEIYHGTKRAVKNGFMITEPGWFTKGKGFRIDSNLINDMQDSVAVGGKIMRRLSTPGVYSKNAIKVYAGDTLDIAKRLKDKGLNPAVLNMADLYEAGGCVEEGLSTQEEELFRRSTYFKSLTPKENPSLRNLFGFSAYPFSSKGTIYTPGVAVFRSGKKTGYKFHEPYAVDLIACAAFNKYVDMPSNPKKYEQGTKEKMRAILRTAVNTGHDSVVLGAFGCGAFDNDPKEVSKFFKEVFAEDEFKGRLKEITFAIIDDSGSVNSNDNYKVFKKELCPWF